MSKLGARGRGKRKEKERGDGEGENKRSETGGTEKGKKWDALKEGDSTGWQRGLAEG